MLGKGWSIDLEKQEGSTIPIGSAEPICFGIMLVPPAGLHTAVRWPGPPFVIPFVPSQSFPVP